MSSPSFGAMSPFMDRVHKLGQFIQHPIDSLMGTMPAPPTQQQMDHDQMVQQMNQQAQAQRVQQANQSHADRMRIEDQKRPLKTK